MFAVIVDTTDARKSLSALSKDLEDEVVKKSVDLAAAKIAKMMAAEATASGLGAVGDSKSDTGWKWETWGRIPRSIAVSKPFKRHIAKGDRGRKVYPSRSRKNPYTKRAAHAHLVILGHRKFIPTGIPGKGQVRLSKKGYQPGRNLFRSSAIRAPQVFYETMESTLKRIIKKSNRQKAK
jgi:hypothetical protein